jgi:hypothetical protein
LGPAEVELLAMLELEDGGSRVGVASGRLTGEAKGKR